MLNDGPATGEESGEASRLPQPLEPVADIVHYHVRRTTPQQGVKYTFLGAARNTTMLWIRLGSHRSSAP